MLRMRPKREGFTLVELLVVIAVIGILVSLTLPVVQSARENARRVQCQNNLRNLGIATHNYVAANNHFPPAAQFRVNESPGVDDPPRHSFITFLLPYFEQSNVYDRFDITKDWNDPANEENAKQHLGGILVCPSAPRGRELKHPSDYRPAVQINPTSETGVGNLVAQGKIKDRAPLAKASGNTKAWKDHQAWKGVLQLYRVVYNSDGGIQKEDRTYVTTATVRDGLSNSFLLFEDGGVPLCYEEGNACTENKKITNFRWASSTLWMTINDSCDADQIVNCTNRSQPYSFHDRGLNLLYADGAVRFHNQAIDPDVFVSLFTAAAGDIASIP